MAPRDIDWKAKNKTVQILEAAEKGKYGVIAAIAYNIEHIIGFVRAAERKKSPLIIQVFPSTVTFTNGLLVHAASIAAKNAKVPIAVHLDHAQNPDLIRDVAENLPFDSIMVDMSHYEKEENLQLTEELVRFCHDRGIATEAEPGRIEGGEDGIADTSAAELQGMLTTADDVEDFLKTDVDFLAPSFGNVHGEYGPKGPQLDFQRFTDITSAISGRMRIALHGTNDFSPELVQKCVAMGVSKINVNKLVLDEYLQHFQFEASRKPLTVLQEEGVNKVEEVMSQWMEWCGSAGKG